MERLEGTVLDGGDGAVAFFARLQTGDRSLRRQRERVAFLLGLSDGTHVRVRARSPRIGPTEAVDPTPATLAELELPDAPMDDDAELERAVLRSGDRVMVEGVVTRGKAADGYRGTAKTVPVAIDAIAIGVGDEAEEFLDDEAARRKRAVFFEELGSLRRLGPKVRWPLRALAAGIVLLLTGAVLVLLRAPVHATRYFAVGLGLLLAIGGLFFLRVALGWKRGRDPASAKSTGTVVLVFGALVFGVLGLNVIGGAVSSGRIGMMAIPLTGVVFLMMTASRRGDARDAYRWAHVGSLTLLILLTVLGGFVSFWNVAQNHYSWEAEVVASDRSLISVGDRCEIAIGYAPKGLVSRSAQCETVVTCGGVTLYGDTQGFVRCVVRDDGIHGEDVDAYDGDGVVTLEGTSGHSEGVRWEGPAWEP